ncbi:MAG: hypothetical protein CSA20_08545 [Deltaproteobacteria bacterium]|nr:MAG: hypothetical protein CSA20_08545 [Deltaproteobacteria bacterium]
MTTDNSYDDDFFAGLAPAPPLMTSGINGMVRGMLINMVMPIVLDIVADMLTAENIHAATDTLRKFGVKVTGKTATEFDDKAWESIANKVLEPSFYAKYGIQFLEIVSGYAAGVDTIWTDGAVQVINAMISALSEFSDSGEFAELAGLA